MSTDRVLFVRRKRSFVPTIHHALLSPDDQLTRPPFDGKSTARQHKSFAFNRTTVRAHTHPREDYNRTECCRQFTRASPGRTNWVGLVVVVFVVFLLSSGGRNPRFYNPRYAWCSAIKRLGTIKLNSVKPCKTLFDIALHTCCASR